MGLTVRCTRSIGTTRISATAPIRRSIRRRSGGSTRSATTRTAGTRSISASCPRSKLVELQLTCNDWYVRHARRILQERGPDAEGARRPQAHPADNPDVTRKLRALWALHVTGGLTESDLQPLLAHESEYLRSWAVLPPRRGQESVRCHRCANSRGWRAQDQSPLVRLYLASALQRVPVDKRWDVLAGLYANDDDATDQNLPLMVWYAAEPVVELDMSRALTRRPIRSCRGSSRSPCSASRRSARRTRCGLTDRLGRTDDGAPRQKELLSGNSASIVNTHRLRHASHEHTGHRRSPRAAVRLLSSCVGRSTPDRAEERHTFKRIQLSDQFWSEGANAGDLNNDGMKDVISGPVVVGGAGLHEAPRVLSGPDDVPVEARPDDDRHRAGLRRRARPGEQVLRQLLRVGARLQQGRLERHPDRRVSRARTHRGSRIRRARTRTGRGTRCSVRPTTSLRRSPT